MQISEMPFPQGRRGKLVQEWAKALAGAIRRKDWEEADRCAQGWAYRSTSRMGVDWEERALAAQAKMAASLGVLHPFHSEEL